MTGGAETDTSFARLRAEAITHAQWASGHIWTDYNIHDPGVTLLEQTCFALSEIGYQAGHATRDLLTAPDGHTDFDGLALYDPRAVLPCPPVTASDLDTIVSEPAPVGRAWLTAVPAAIRLLPDTNAALSADFDKRPETFDAPEGTAPFPAAPETVAQGLFSLTVIPAARADGHETEGWSKTARTAAEAAFYAARPLATDIDPARAAKARRTVLHWTVQILPTVKPERVAAQLYYAVAAILRGQPIAEAHHGGATRGKVFDAPELFLHEPARPLPETPNIDPFLAQLRQIPGITDIGTPSFQAVDPVLAGRKNTPTYPALHMPGDGGAVGLRLMVGDNDVTLDEHQIAEELIRVQADDIALAHHHLDGDDWNVLTDGHRRDFTRADVDALLPAIYSIHRPDQPARRDDPRSAQSAPPDALEVYRGAIEAHLTDMSATLAALPEIFAAAMASPGDPVDSIATAPAAHRRRIEVLDHLIALQGEEMPQTRHAGLDHYRSRREAARFALAWRLAYLRDLPTLNAQRGTGPGRRRPGGFLARICHLADLAAMPRDNPAAGLAHTGLSLTDEAPPDPTWATDKGAMLDPFDMLVPHDGNAEATPPEDLAAGTPWARNGRINRALFHRAAHRDAFAVIPCDDLWQPVFDPGAAMGEPVRRGHFALGAATTREAAQARVTAQRAAWRGLQEGAEAAYLVEDIRLRGADSAFRPHAATLVLTGWTARTALPAYRRYVADLVALHAPAHVLIRLLWLDAPDMTRFHVLYSAWRKAGRAKPEDFAARRPLRDFLDHARSLT